MVHLHSRCLRTGAAVVAAALLVAGCHSVADQAATPAQTSVAPTTGTVAGLVGRQVDGLTTFTSPSGEVGCLLDATMARCDISERNWAPPLRPADCEFDYGQGIALSPGSPAEFVCAGDTALGTGEQLAYGDSITVGLLSCESADDGIACRDVESGHGFSISTAAYHLF